MKILIVDDESISLKRLKHYCNQFGYTVLEAENGVEALEIWHSQHPKIVITDRSMPKMGGLELCSRIRQEEGDNYTYIIILTGLSEMHEIIAGMQVGADDYITKPFNKDELYFRIKAGERVINLQNRDMVIFTLAKLAESRDSDTGNHLERVRYYCKILAEKLLKSPTPPAILTFKFVENIFLTSALHDIGKVGIPDRILLKPGKLDQAEFEIMKTHTNIGFNTLNEALKKNPRAEYLKMSAEIALSHHEKFDGSGYPNGLKGDAVPLAARIMALADVYDALTTKRVYKDAMSHEKAKAIILDGRGRHFDPLVIKAFMNSLELFEQIKQEFCDDDKLNQKNEYPLAQEYNI